MASGTGPPQGAVEGGLLGVPKAIYESFIGKIGKCIIVSIIYIFWNADWLKWNLKIILENVFSGGPPCQNRPQDVILGNFLQFCSQK